MQKLVNRWLRRWGLEDETHHRVFWFVLGLATGALLISFVLLVSSSNPSAIFEWFGSTTQGFGTEMLGALGTFLIVERIMDKQREVRQKEEDEARQKRDQRDQLIDQLIGNDTLKAKRAIEILREKGWFRDGMLKGQNLRSANLREADLREANLETTTLADARLNGANLLRARMSRSDLWGADLESASLDGTDLRGANLRKCRMKNARLRGNYFDEQTTLPDGNLWSATTDMTRFTDPEHPEYFDSCANDPDLWYCQQS